MLRLYGYLESGNGSKVRRLLHQLGCCIELDILKGETRTPAFLAKNPNRRIPTLELEDGRCAAALGVLEGHLARRPFFAAARYTSADIALCAYTDVAEQGGFALGPYPAIRTWLERVVGEPGRVPITQG